ncbi:MAG: amidohydrolase family protein [Blastocatellia bacterium]|nr:amidohydrolase family protein [Blastocatellia bacterium]
MKEKVFIKFLIVLVVVVLLVPLSHSWAAPEVSYAIKGAKVYTLAGSPIDNATVVIKNGKIEAVGNSVSVPTGAKVIDARGLEVYPGLFDSATQLGLIEIESISATVDTADIATYNPQLVAATAINPNSEHIPVARANGITHALSAPGLPAVASGTGPTIGGQASAINLSGWVIDEMLIDRSAAMVINWPTFATGSFDFTTFQFRQRPFNEVKQEYEKRVAELANLLNQARHYSQAVEKGSLQKFERDLKLEALIPVIRGEKPVMVFANDDRLIKSAVEFCEKQKLKMILTGGAEAWKVKDLLKEKNIPVILRPTQSMPTDEDEAYDKPYSTAGELSAAGVKIAIATFNSADSRTLAQEAGHAVPYGLPREEALKAITIYPAEIFGLSDKLGTIEKGKIANIIVTTGDPLEIRNEVKYLFINGKLTSLDNKHFQLYEKYRQRN